MVRLLGIKITRPYIVMFGIGAALAGIAGVVGGPLSNINPEIGMTILVPAFLTVVIGGVGSIRALSSAARSSAWSRSRSSRSVR